MPVHRDYHCCTDLVGKNHVSSLSLRAKCFQREQQLGYSSKEARNLHFSLHVEKERFSTEIRQTLTIVNKKGNF